MNPTSLCASYITLCPRSTLEFSRAACSQCIKDPPCVMSLSSCPRILAKGPLHSQSGTFLFFLVSLWLPGIKLSHYRKHSNPFEQPEGMRMTRSPIPLASTLLLTSVHNIFVSWSCTLPFQYFHYILFVQCYPIIYRRYFDQNSS